MAVEKKNDARQDVKSNSKKTLKKDVILAKKEDIFLLKKKEILYFLILILILFSFIPRLYLYGENKVVLEYNDEYIESGYGANILFYDIKNKVTVLNNVNTSLVGEYKIYYILKLGLFKIKRVREVIVVDKKEPVIDIESDEIKVCPNLDKPVDVSYVAYDEYDGDITDSVIKEFEEEKVILSVSDTSGNTTSREIRINAIDTDAPSITLKGSKTIYLNFGRKYVEPGYSAFDNCDGDLTENVVVSGTVGSTIGTYTLKYSAVDSSNNKSEVVRTIVVTNGALYNSGTIKKGAIYLTFDDGPSYGTTNVILDILKEENVKATFFVTCSGPDNLIKRIYDEGHTVALHTASHTYSYVYSSVNNYFNDLNKVSDRVKRITGVESKIVRFPGGSSNTISRNYSVGIMSQLALTLLDRGYRYFDWNVDAMDASTARSSSDVYNNVMYNISKDKANVVLMHDIKAITRDALRNIIRNAKAQGYAFEKIDMDTYMIRHDINN